MVVAIGGETDDRRAAVGRSRGGAAAIDRLDAWGTTPLYDATLGALDAIQPARGRRALVLLSDGTDRYSDTKRRGPGRSRAAPRRADLSGGGRRRARPPVFAELAAATGGRSFCVREPAALDDAR